MPNGERFTHPDLGLGYQLDLPPAEPFTTDNFESAVDYVQFCSGRPDVDALDGLDEAQRSWAETIVERCWKPSRNLLPALQRDYEAWVDYERQPVADRKYNAGQQVAKTVLVVTIINAQGESSSVVAAVRPSLITA